MLIQIMYILENPPKKETGKTKSNPIRFASPGGPVLLGLCFDRVVRRSCVCSRTGTPKNSPKHPKVHPKTVPDPLTKRGGVFVRGCRPFRGAPKDPHGCLKAPKRALKASQKCLLQRLGSPGTLPVKYLPNPCNLQDGMLAFFCRK